MTLRPAFLIMFLAGFAAGTMFLLSCGGGGRADAHSQFSTVYHRRSNLNSVSVDASSAFEPIGPPLVFEKIAGSTKVEVILNTRIVLGGVTGTASGALFELRIDGAAPVGDISSHASVLSMEPSQYVSVFAAFEGLSAGQHTAQVYVRSTGNGSAIGILLDPGGFGGSLITREAP